ncbi:hypothetical protein OJJOAM_003870 [Cupriavidus sp. H18C1]
MPSRINAQRGTASFCRRASSLLKKNGRLATPVNGSVSAAGTAPAAIASDLATIPAPFVIVDIVLGQLSRQV